MGAMPTGISTLLFTDIEGHSPLWEAHPDAMRVALERHDEILRRRATRPHQRDGGTCATRSPARCWMGRGRTGALRSTRGARRPGSSAAPLAMKPPARFVAAVVVLRRRGRLHYRQRHLVRPLMIPTPRRHPRRSCCVWPQGTATCKPGRCCSDRRSIIAAPKRPSGRVEPARSLGPGRAVSPTAQRRTFSSGFRRAGRADTGRCRTCAERRMIERLDRATPPATARLGRTPFS